MGHFQETIETGGWTEQEAHREAADMGPEVTGFHDCHYRATLSRVQLRAPKPPRAVVVKSPPPTVKPVWAKRWVVAQYWRTGGGQSETPCQNKRDAIAKAKSLAEQNKTEVEVVHKYVCISGSPPKTVIRLEGGQKGRWRFKMDFHA